MKKSLASLTCILVSVFLISCQKDNDAVDPAGLIGSYKFVSLKTDVVATSIATNGSDIEKAVTVTKYVTKNNTGTITFTPTTLSSNNLSYQIDTTILVSYYTNGDLDFSTDMPFQFEVPPTSSTTSYKVISSDSVYFSSGSMFVDGSATQATQPSGAKLKREGDLLILSIPTNKTTTDNSQGVPITTAFQGVATITLQKQ